MAENRLKREDETREKTARKRAWLRADTLPTPHPEDGYEFHWVRVSTRGEVDAMNVSLKFREGWEPVKASDHPEIFVAGIENDRFKDNILIGGLLLCKTPTETVAERNEFFLNESVNQIRSVDNNLMRENDPRMPLFNERKTKVTFGKGT
jgi:hypothetical protein